MGHLEKYRVTKAHHEAVKAQHAQILELRERYQLTITAIADRYGVSQGMIREILKNAKEKVLPKLPL